MATKNSWANFTIAAVALLGVSSIGLSDCGTDEIAGVTRECGNGYSWIFGQTSYAIDGQHFFGFAPRDAQWEYVSEGWNGRSCEQNESGVFIAAPNITITEAESARYRRLSFSVPFTILMQTTKFLPSNGSAVLSYELQANNKTLIGPQILSIDTLWNFDSGRRFVSREDYLTGTTVINNEELRNVKIVISNLIQKVDPSKDYRCYKFDIVLGKARIDLLP